MDEFSFLTHFHQVFQSSQFSRETLLSLLSQAIVFPSFIIHCRFWAFFCFLNEVIVQQTLNGTVKGSWSHRYCS